jgi:hypothetical protein
MLLTPGHGSVAYYKCSRASSSAVPLTACLALYPHLLCHLSSLLLWVTVILPQFTICYGVSAHPLPSEMDTRKMTWPVMAVLLAGSKAEPCLIMRQ